jgi:hypothetical protein
MQDSGDIMIKQDILNHKNLTTAQTVFCAPIGKWVFPQALIHVPHKRENPGLACE